MVLVFLTIEQFTLAHGLIVAAGSHLSQGEKWILARRACKEDFKLAIKGERDKTDHPEMSLGER